MLLFDLVCFASFDRIPVLWCHCGQLTLLKKWFTSRIEGDGTSARITHDLCSWCRILLRSLSERFKRGNRYFVFLLRGAKLRFTLTIAGHLLDLLAYNGSVRGLIWVLDQSLQMIIKGLYRWYELSSLQDVWVFDLLPACVLLVFAYVLHL